MSASAEGCSPAAGGCAPRWEEALDLYELYHAIELWDWFAAGGRTDLLGGLTQRIRELSA